MNEPGLLNVTEQLLSLPKMGTGIGLHRMQFLTKKILDSNWFEHIDPISIVGSKGKGSTTRIISAILECLKIKTGQYTSPHLLSFPERIVFDGQPISTEQLTSQFQHFLAQKAAYAKDNAQDLIGAFEAITSIALHHFADCSAEAIVLEAGIGGRYDSTRIFSGTHIGLTSIELEHTSLLGNTKEQIAFDKIDIAREGSTLVIGDLEEDLKKRILQYAQLKSLRVLSIAEEAEAHNIRFIEDQMLFDIAIGDLKINSLASKLPGYHQVSNILVAIVLLKSWLAENRPEVTVAKFKAAIIEGLAELHWPGRLQKIKEEPSFFIDVAHTPQSIAQLVHSFPALQSKPCLLITGVSYDKKYEEIIRQLIPLATVIVCTEARHKGCAAEKIYAIAKARGGTNQEVHLKKEIIEAVDFSLEYAQKHKMCILVAGGLFLSMEVYHYLKGNNPGTLKFL